MPRVGDPRVLVQKVVGGDDESPAMTPNPCLDWSRKILDQVLSGQCKHIRYCDDDNDSNVNESTGAGPGGHLDIAPGAAPHPKRLRGEAPHHPLQVGEMSGGAGLRRDGEDDGRSQDAPPVQPGLG